MATVTDPQWEYPFGLHIPAVFALEARRHMYEYGTTERQLASVAVSNSKWAALHPNATLRQPTTIEEVLSSRMIASPLHRQDVPLVSDGGAALILTSADGARDFPKPPVYISGWAQASGGQHVVYMPDLVSHEQTRIAAERAFSMAGVSPEDVDIFYPYDGATIVPIIALEEFGFCKKGEAGPFVEGGNTAPGGKLPMTTHGGVLRYGHFGIGAGLTSFVEAVRQLRGECGERQVKDAELAAISTEAGFMTYDALILRR